MKLCINWLEQRTEKQRQWLWFILLWCGGLGSVMFLGLIIRTAMGIK